MANNRITEYLKFANLQMASEAFLDRLGFDKSAVTRSSNAAELGRYVEALQLGNTHASKFTQVQAEQFALDWEVLAHKDNAPTVSGSTQVKGARLD